MQGVARLVNQKRAAYQAHTALECNSLFIVLTSKLAAPLIVHSTKSTTLQVLAWLLTKTRYTHKKSGLHPFQKQFLNRKGTIISKHGVYRRKEK
jgi:hypothetical protein